MNFKRNSLSLLSVALLPFGLSAQTEAIFQDSARPYGYDVVAPVSQAASDAASADFHANTLPTLLNFVDENLGESQALSSVNSVAVDPTQLKVATDYNVRVYFVHEGASFHNTLGFSTSDAVTGAETQGRSLIFPDVSSHNQYYENPQSKESPSGSANDAMRSDGNPLLQGDFVDLGVIAGGNILDFFLLSDGANGGDKFFVADKTLNPDGLQHMVAFTVPDSPYLLIGFEDVFFGGDFDYNDAMFVVDIGEASVAQLAPEPSTVAMMALLAAFGVFLYRRPSTALALG